MLLNFVTKYSVPKRLTLETIIKESEFFWGSELMGIEFTRPPPKTL